MQVIKKGDPSKTVEAKKLKKEKKLKENLEFINKIDKRLAETFYAIQADSYASHQIWRRFFYDIPKEERKFDFVQDCSGLSFEIGKIDKRPVVLTFYWFIVNGHRVAFYCCESQLCDWKMVEEWLEKYMPHLKHTSNATNAHNVLNFLED